MTIERIQPNKIKVLLDGQELQTFALSFEKLSYKDPRSRRFLQQLYFACAEASGLTRTPGKLMIEIYPFINRGCVVLFTVPSGDAPRKLRLKKASTYIFRFTDGGDLLGCMRRLHPNARDITDSALYRMQGGYYLQLALRPGAGTQALLCLQEYAARVRIHPGMLSERGSLICTDAVEKLCAAMSH